MTSIHQEFTNRHAELERSMGEPLLLSGLVGPLRMFQRARGHRQGLDDATTAWFALQKAPEASCSLDLGSGAGSVGLAVQWGLGETAHLTCVEAQDLSFKLLSANVSANGVADRTVIYHQDLRDFAIPKKFPLITGSPPYFPKGMGTLPGDSQKAYARFELRGHVGDYATAAKRHLEKDGVFIYCFPARQKQRGLDLVLEAGLVVTHLRDVLPKRSKEALFSLCAARLESESPLIEEAPLIVAEESGQYTEEMVAIQRSRGFEANRSNFN